MASIPSGKPLTGEPDAGNLPVRFGGRGSGKPLSLPLFYSVSAATPPSFFLFFSGAAGGQINRRARPAPLKNKKKDKGSRFSYRRVTPSGVFGPLARAGEGTKARNPSGVHQSLDKAKLSPGIYVNLGVGIGHGRSVETISRSASLETPLGVACL